MISVRPTDVVNVTTKKSWSDGAKCLLMVEETKIGLALDVSEVVPCADPGTVGEMRHQSFELGEGGDLLVMTSSFDANFDACFFGEGQESFEGVEGSLEGGFCCSGSLSDEVELGGDVVPTELTSTEGEPFEHGSEWLHGDASHVDDHSVSADPHRRFERLLGEFDGATATEFDGIRKLVHIRGIMEDLDRRGAGVMNAGDLNDALIDGLVKSLHECQPGAVADLDGVKAEFTGFFCDGLSVPMTVSVPAGGERDHWSWSVSLVTMTGSLSWVPGFSARVSQVKTLMLGRLVFPVRTTTLI